MITVTARFRLRDRVSVGVRDTPLARIVASMESSASTEPTESPASTEPMESSAVGRGEAA